MVTAILETPFVTCRQVAVCGSFQIRRTYKVTRFLQRHPVTRVAIEKENLGISFTLMRFKGHIIFKIEKQVGLLELVFSQDKSVKKEHENLKY